MATTRNGDPWSAPGSPERPRERPPLESGTNPDPRACHSAEEEGMTGTQPLRHDTVDGPQRCIGVVGVAVVGVVGSVVALEEQCVCRQSPGYLCTRPESSGPTLGMTPSVGAAGTRRPSGRNPKNAAK